MRKVRLLNFVVSSTLILLTIGAMLVVLGLFNEGLHWDIFGPKLEAVLYGVFGSCMALAGFGMAMTLIIAIQESVRDFKTFVQVRTNREESPDAPKRAYIARMLCMVALMAAIVIICAAINHVVLTQRCKVFKRLAKEQSANFENRINANLSIASVTQTNNVPPDLYDILKSLNDLDFIQGTVLYVPDAVESAILWNYQAQGNCYTNSGSFSRFYIAKDYEKAMHKAFVGNPKELDEINSRNDFVWYALLSASNRPPRAVIRIEGNRNQSFRDYSLGE